MDHRAEIGLPNKYDIVIDAALPIRCSESPARLDTRWSQGLGWSDTPIAEPVDAGQRFVYPLRKSEGVDLLAHLEQPLQLPGIDISTLLEPLEWRARGVIATT